MEAIAKHRKIAMSPRKARLVVDLIRNMKVHPALDTLSQLSNKAAPYVSKLLKSAVANLAYKNKGKKFLKESIYIQEIYVDGGKVLKRIQPASRGRAHPIRKPSCHITVKVKWDEGIDLVPAKNSVLSKEDEKVEVAESKVETASPVAKKRLEEEKVEEKSVTAKKGEHAKMKEKITPTAEKAPKKQESSAKEKSEVAEKSKTKE